VPQALPMEQSQALILRWVQAAVGAGAGGGSSQAGGAGGSGGAGGGSVTLNASGNLTIPVGALIAANGAAGGAGGAGGFTAGTSSYTCSPNVSIQLKLHSFRN